MNILEQFRRSLTIAKKDLSLYYFQGPVVIQGLLIPAFLFISFFFGKNTSLTFLIPNLLGMALFFAVSAITPVIAPWETRMKTFERLVSSPIPFWAIILGDVMASALFGFLITTIIFVIAIILLGGGILSFSLIAGSIVAAFCFSTLGVLISAPPTDKPSNTMMLATLIKFPLLFISGIFTPIETMGKFKFLSFISPLTYYVDLARYSIEGVGYFSPTMNIGILFAFTLCLFMISLLWHKKSLEKRF
jgi:ABC-2 type transport system permease protein